MTWPLEVNSSARCCNVHSMQVSNKKQNTNNNNKASKAIDIGNRAYPTGEETGWPFPVTLRGVTDVRWLSYAEPVTTKLTQMSTICGNPVVFVYSLFTSTFYTYNVIISIILKHVQTGIKLTTMCCPMGHIFTYGRYIATGSRLSYVIDTSPPQ